MVRCMNIRATVTTALRQNEKKQGKLIEEAKRLRGFLLALGPGRGVRHRKKRRKLKSVK